MAKYIINKNTDANGNNEIHNLDKFPSCGHLPMVENREVLGNFQTDKEALSHAKKMGWKNADGCYFCCESIHTK